MINQELSEFIDIPSFSIPQSPRQEELRLKSIDELKYQISVIDQENSQLAETIHNLEKELELKRSKVTLQISKLKEDKLLSTYITFFIFLFLSFYFLLFPSSKKQ